MKRFLLTILLVTLMAKTVQADRPLPFSADAERSVLGAILLDNRQLDALAGLTSEDFFLDQHRKIFSVAVELQQENTPVDSLTLMEALDRRGELEAAGGAAYLGSLLDGVPRVSNVEHHARMVKEKALLRAAIHEAARLQELAFEGGDVQELLDHSAERMLHLAIAAASGHTAARSYFEAAMALLGKLEAPEKGVRVFTDHPTLDLRTGGFRAREYVSITAGTGVGKTIIARQATRRACRDGWHGCYFSGEMSGERLAARDLGRVSGVKMGKFRNPEYLDDQDWKSLRDAVGQECRECRVYDQPLSLRGIRSTARKLHRTAPLGWVVVDYDSLVEVEGAKSDYDQQITLVKGLYRLAQELAVPMLVISQLRKSLSPEEAANPTIERILGAGAKSHFADFVLLFDRPYVRDLQGDETEASIFILKNREGQVGKVLARFNVRTLEFEDHGQEPPPAPARRRTAKEERDA